MSFWKPTKTKKREPRAPDTGQAVPVRKKIHRSSPVVFEAKMLAIEAVNSGADRQDIAKIRHMVENLERGRIAPVEFIARKSAFSG